MKLTVAICTWNRCQLLDKTLEQMRNLEIPEGVEWELLVVNNNCTDATDEVLEKYQNCLPLRRLWEPTPGQTSARNRAIAEAEGDWIIWTDDDVLVSKNWLQAYHDAFMDHPEAGFFGGSIEPWFEGDRPNWLEQSWLLVAEIYVVRTFDSKPAPLTVDYLPYGANFAVRTDIQRKYLFDPTIGHRGNLLMGGDEVKVLTQMLDDGLVGWSVPSATVRHWIPKDRQTLQYIAQRFDGIGQLSVRDMMNSDSPRIFGRPRWLYREAVQASLKYYTSRLFCKPEQWMANFIQANLWLGRLRGFKKPVEHFEPHAVGSE